MIYYRNLGGIRYFCGYDPKTGDLYRVLGREAADPYSLRRVNYRKSDYGKGPSALRKHMVSIKRKLYPATYIVWRIVYGRLPRKGFVIDHINGDATDDRLENLREVTIRGNAHNLQTHRAGKAVGVDVLPSGRFRARISLKGKLTQLGTYDTQEEASKAVQEALS